MNCETAKQYLLLMNYSELSFDEEEALEQHLGACPECQAERERLEKFEDILAHGESEMPAGLLSRCRRDLATRIQEEERPARRFAPGRLWRDWVINTPIWLRPLGAVAMLALGFMGARMIPQSQTLTKLADAAGVAEPGPVFTRVRLVNPDESGQVRVMLEETRQRELTGSLNDDHIRRLLLAAAADPADPGLRVETMDLLKSQCSNDDVKRALLNALRTDTNSGVRLKALEGLKPYAKEEETRNVLAEVLLKDDNPGVRTQAIDLLIQSKEPEVVGVLQELLRREDNSYVRSRSQRALTEMKASMGTF